LAAEEHIRKKIRRIVMPGGEVESVCALESVPLLSALSATAPDTSAEETGADPAELLSQWLSFYGPVSPSFVGKALGLTEERLEHLLAELDGE